MLLIVREAPTNDPGAAPFLLLGPVRYVERRGERPMAIIRQLRGADPARRAADSTSRHQLTRAACWSGTVQS